MTASQLNPVSNLEMQEAIHRALAQGFVGQADVAFALGDRAEFLIQAGRVCAVLWSEKTRKKSLPGAGWAELFASPQMGVVTLRPATGRFLNLQQACFAGAPREEKFKFPNTELEQLIGAYTGQESATVFSLRWNNGQGYVLVPGSNLRMQRAVFLWGTEFESDDAALSAMLYWRDPTCEVRVFQQGLENPFWVGLHLNVLFEYFSSHWLTQYGYLTGKVMISSMVRNVAYAATQRGYDMLNVANRLQDHSFFGSVAETSQAYKDLLALMEQQMESVVGSRFVTAAKAQACDALNPFYGELARTYGLGA
jgi:hypothetical protein